MDVYGGDITLGDIPHGISSIRLLLSMQLVTNSVAICKKEKCHGNRQLVDS